MDCYLTISVIRMGASWRLGADLHKRLSQQPALGALTFLRSFVAGRANFCSHFLASLVHFTVVKSQATLSIPASKRRKFLPRWIGPGTKIGHVDSAYRSSLWQQRCSREDELIKRKKAKKHQYPTFLLNISQLHSNASENLWCNKFSL